MRSTAHTYFRQYSIYLIRLDVNDDVATDKTSDRSLSVIFFFFGNIF